ncbi:MAG: B12-binding domain-containing radical SAM protein [Nitrospirae bacterium]|nr:B12-binding domain-containing radical SAM protein [Nitrospirota bacterium]
MYLAAYLRKYSGCEVKLLDASARIDLKRWEGDFLKYGYTDEMIVREVVNYQPDLVGISSMFTINSKGVHDTAGLIKKTAREIPIIIGGAHASAFPHWVLKDDNVSAVVKGEGEKTLLAIADRIVNKKSFLDLDGVVFRNVDGIVENRAREYIADLDTIPFPARDLLDMNVYFNEKYNYSHSMSPPRTTIVSSRGCPYRCTFCSIHSLWRHTYRMRSAQNVADEIEHLKNEYRVREVAFFDDNLTVSKKRMIAICDEIVGRKLDIHWCTPNGIAIWTLDKEVLSKMRESGCYKLTFGIETASPNTQKFIRKEHIDLNKSKELIRYCNEIGIWTHSTFIIGFPYETEADIMKTIDYAVSCGVDMATFFIATPYPGTEMYDIYKKENLLPDVGASNALEWLGAVNKAMCDTKYLKLEQIERFIALAQRKVYLDRAISFLNPLRAFPKIKGKDEIRYFVKQLYSYSKRLLKSLHK